MDQLFLALVLGFIGLCFGSFAGAQLWRLRARQLVEDKLQGEAYDKKEYAQLVGLTKHTGVDDRSRCLSCGHQLAWYDILPLVSWCSTAGKCRYCHASIGLFEPLMELGMAGFFVVSFLFWPQSLVAPLDITQFVLWLVGGVMLTILLAYDLKWFLLPDIIMFPLIALGLVYATIELSQASDFATALFSLLGAVLILAGLYLALWLVSRGRWIGFGDVKLGLALALLLGSWELGFLTLFLANLLGCVIVIPGLILGRLSRTTQVPFGPMLIGGFFIAVLFGHQLIDWYLSFSASLFI